MPPISIEDVDLTMTDQGLHQTVQTPQFNAEVVGSDSSTHYLASSIQQRFFKRKKKKKKGLRYAAKAEIGEFRMAKALLQ